MTGGPPVTLDALIWGWADAYRIGYQEDHWIAARRDGRAVLLTATLAGLEQMIQADYRYQPVPRTCDPPPTSPADEDSDPGGPGKDEAFLLAALTEAFPACTLHLREVAGHRVDAR